MSASEIRSSKAEELRVVHQPLPRHDQQEKIAGSTRYAGDLAFTNMLHARLVRAAGALGEDHPAGRGGGRGGAGRRLRPVRRGRAEQRHLGRRPRPDGRGGGAEGEHGGARDRPGPLPRRARRAGRGGQRGGAHRGVRPGGHRVRGAARRLRPGRGAGAGRARGPRAGEPARRVEHRPRRRGRGVRRRRRHRRGHVPDAAGRSRLPGAGGGRRLAGRRRGAHPPGRDPGGGALPGRGQDPRRAGLPGAGDRALRRRRVRRQGGHDRRALPRARRVAHPAPGPDAVDAAGVAAGPAQAARDALRYRTAARADGTILGQEVDIIADAGAYAYLSALVLLYSSVHACGPYRVDNVRLRARCAYTNNPPDVGVPRLRRHAGGVRLRVADGPAGAPARHPARRDPQAQRAGPGRRPAGRAADRDRGAAGADDRRGVRPGRRQAAPVRAAPRGRPRHRLQHPVLRPARLAQRLGGGLGRLPDGRQAHRPLRRARHRRRAGVVAGADRLRGARHARWTGSPCTSATRR